MREEVKKKWVAALKNGEYEQGRAQLKNEGKFCCLGVLCDLHRKTIKKKGCRWEDNGYLNSMDTLPEEVQEWAGLDSKDPCVVVSELESAERLSRINDEGTSFKEIAKLINEQL